MQSRYIRFILFILSLTGLSGLVLFPAITDEAFSGQYSDHLNQDRSLASHSEKFSANTVAAADTGKEDADESDSDAWAEEADEKPIAVSDPLSPFNRAMFEFNDRLYFWVLKPVSRGYMAVAPRPVRMGIKNFFNNIKTPIRFAACLLQGKGHAAMAEYCRFIINSTAGVMGFGNPAKKFPQLNPNEEDMGQTLGYYGLGNGIYLVWPFFGPSTLRDTIGMASDQLFLDPVSYVEPIAAEFGVKAWETVNATSFKIGDYESLKSSAIQPYEAFRNAYIQYRSKRVSE
jgi:phospholipid-binding lipoprotein MlaA